MTAPKVLNTAAIGDLLGISRRAVTLYLKRWAGTDNEFPAPDMQLDGRLYWYAEREGEVRAWKARQAGRTGRPKKVVPRS